jgi:LPPG:FO 2-phospho-L-lactate transferase
VVIGPSNPVISIGPILAIAEIRNALSTRGAPVVAVSPFVGGEVVKGPTEVFMDWAGEPKSSVGIAALYAGLIDGLVADEDTDSLPVRVTDVLMADAPARARVAEVALSFALSLGR